METTHAYFAGLVDGDGCITISREDLVITVTNSYKPALDDLCSIYGGSIYVSNEATNRSRAVYVWKLWSLKAADVLRSLLPYLRIKRNQASVGIQFQETKDIRHRTIPLK